MKFQGKVIKEKGVSGKPWKAELEGWKIWGKKERKKEVVNMKPGIR